MLLVTKPLPALPPRNRRGSPSGERCAALGDRRFVGNGRFPLAVPIVTLKLRSRLPLLVGCVTRLFVLLATAARNLFVIDFSCDAAELKERFVVLDVVPALLLKNPFIF